ncbi:uncharacterized protein LOC106661040 [Cimex lectularius]|uniref:Late endosomal/lysosomal adaptor and MAPK and MTOR activator 5 n=1 Tax=Cimex lectularius TaxID=79782 RepID=A0A8I6R691_CIMLE|nr:uncharacterized protein LOC106661040 [Cimex lectularius]
MEAGLVTAFNEIINNENVTGCVLTNPQGLCMLSSPNLKPEVSGLVSAISQHAAKLEDSDGPPIITLEGDNRMCLILTEGGYTTTIFKKTSHQF